MQWQPTPHIKVALCLSSIYYVHKEAMLHKKTRERKNYVSKHKIPLNE